MKLTKFDQKEFYPSELTLDLNWTSPVDYDFTTIHLKRLLADSLCIMIT